MADRKKVLLGLAVALVVTAVITGFILTTAKAPDKDSADSQSGSIKERHFRIEREFAESMRELAEAGVEIARLKEKHNALGKELDTLSIDDMKKRINKVGRDLNELEEGYGQLHQRCEKAEQECQDLIKKIEEALESSRASHKSTDVSDQVEEDKE